ncbi:PAS domain-containing protein [Salinarimonas sp.]|uniref:hybrid sensor histidine kinase/response regulator n=1 Tax=Salinarimonas sp. TaxID=2766526 RepID=UPI00391E01BD
MTARSIDREHAPPALDTQTRLRLALEAAGMGDAELDLHTLRCIRSPSVDAMFGLAPDAADEDGRTLLARIHPDDAARVEAAIAEVARTGGAFAEEFRIPLADGGRRWIAWSGKVVSVEGDRRLVGVLREVTDRKDTQEALRASEERYRLATLAFRGFVYDWDVATNAVVRSAGLHEVLGYAPDEVEPCLAWWREQIHPEDRKICEARVESLVAAGATRFATEVRARHKDGHWVWLADRGNIVRDATGTPVRVVGTTIDVSETRAAQEALRESEERLRRSERSLRMATEAAQMYSWEIDLRTLTIAWGSNAEPALGLPPGTLPPTFAATLALVHAEDASRIGEEVGTAMERGEDFEIEFRIRAPQGLVWVWSQGVAVRDEDGRLVRYVGVGRNVTDRMRYQEELRRQVHERTLAAEEALSRLYEAQKLESIGQLTGGVAHDFNNLLAAILSNLELLRKRIGDDPRSLRLLDGAVQGAERGASLTRRLLAFARRQDLQTQSVSLSALVGGMIELLSRSLGPGVRIVTELPDDLPLVAVDAHQLELALLNLAVNARDAMPGGGTLTIAARAGAPAPHGLPSGDYLCLSVADTGAGMDGATLRRATEPFFTTKGVGKGTGLGLSMVHGLAVQSGGALTLDSHPGAGTRVCLWLPRASETPRAPDAPAGAVPSPARAATAPGASPRPLSVLVVDDDALVRMGTASMLEDLGHEPIEAESGPEALAILASGQPIDIVVTDHAMPGMTGTELAARIRAERPGLPVALATGYAELPNGERVDLPRLAKPFRQEDLAALLETLAAALA